MIQQSAMKMLNLTAFSESKCVCFGKKRQTVNQQVTLGMLLLKISIK